MIVAKSSYRKHKRKVSRRAVSESLPPVCTILNRGIVPIRSKHRKRYWDMLSAAGRKQILRSKVIAGDSIFGKNPVIKEKESVIGEQIFCDNVILLVKEKLLKSGVHFID